MEQAVDILKQVQTPLQLAALALLLVYAVAKVLIATNRWTPSDALVKLFLDRAALLGLVALVLGVGGPLLSGWANPDDLISGSVYGKDGSALRNAVVGAPPVGGQPVRSDGSFELRVPRHIRRDQYTVTAAAEGFRTETRTVPRAAIRSVDFQLASQPDHAIRSISPELVVGQFYGLPFVVVSMQARAPGSTQLWVSEVTAQLSNGAINISLFPQFVTTLSPTGPFLAVTGLVPISPGPPAPLRFLLAPNGDIGGLVRTISALPEYQGAAPCALSGGGSSSPLTSRAFAMVETFARGKFIWTAGTWTLRFRITAGDQQDTLDKTFELSAAEVEGLRNSIALARSCQTTSFMAPLAQDGAMSNYLLR